MADAVIEQVETATKYAGYIDKQGEEVAPGHGRQRSTGFPGTNPRTAS